MNKIKKKIDKIGIIILTFLVFIFGYVWKDMILLRLNIINDLFTIIGEGLAKMDSHYVGIILFSIITGTITNFIHSILSFITFIIKSFFLSWITIDNINPEGPEVYEWLIYYLNNKMKEKKLYSITNSVETADSLKKIWYNRNIADYFYQTRFIPGNSWSILFEGCRPIIVRIHYEPSKSDMWNQSHFIPKHIIMYTISLGFCRNKVWEDFVNKIMNKYKNDINKYQRIYKNGRWGGWSNPILVNRLKINSGTFILTDNMKKIVDGISDFLTDKTRENYKEKGFDYSRRICVYGPPGTGKSNLAVRIAGEFNLPIYYINCLGIDDNRLIDLFDRVQRGIIIVEEIDKCINELNEEMLEENEDLLKKNKSRDKITFPTLTAWHKVLDKLMGSQVIVYMTTNNFKKLRDLNQGSLIRSERIDQKIMLGYIDMSFINQIINKYYKTNGKLYMDYYKMPKKYYLTPSDIINLLKEYKDFEIVVEKIYNLASKKVAGNSSIPNRREFIDFIEKLTEKYNMTLSYNFMEKFIIILNKNSIKNIDDLIFLLKNNKYKEKLLQNSNLPIVDEIKLEYIIKKEFGGNYSFDSLGKRIKLSDRMLHFVKNLFEKNNLKPTEEFYDVFANIMKENKINTEEDLVLILKDNKNRDSIVKSEHLSKIDQIKLHKIVEIEF